MLTTTVDGLWALQVLTGIEVVAAELGLRPHLPSVEEKAMALAHPVAAELRSAGVIVNGAVDATVVEWLTVLDRRETALLLCAQAPNGGGEPDRILLARFAQWWVALERCGAMVRLSAAGRAVTAISAGLMIDAQIGRLCDERPPAAIRPVTLDSGELTRQVKDRESLRRFLVEQGLDGDQTAALLLAGDPERSFQISIVAVQSGVATAPNRSFIEPGAVTVIDTPNGRLVAEHIPRAGTNWMVISSGSTATLGAAVQRMLCRLPARNDWYSYRKAV